MKMDKYDRSQFVAILIIVFFTFLNLGFILYQEDLILLEQSYSSRVLDIPINEISECEDMDLLNTTYCLRSYIKGFYNYTVRNELIYEGDEGSLEDIKLNGGDCYDYTKIYIESFEELGFETEKINIPRHTYLVVYDDSYYCNIDQLTIECRRFLSKDEKEN